MARLPAPPPTVAESSNCPKGATPLPDHKIVTDHVKSFFAAAEAESMPTAEILVMLETFLVVGLLYAAALSGTPQPRRYITELLDVMTERAAGRVNDYIDSVI